MGQGLKKEVNPSKYVKIENRRKTETSFSDL